MRLSVSRAIMSFMASVLDVDDFGLPAGILGIHPDEFFGALGRIVCVSAVLEGQVATLRHSLANAQQGEFTKAPVSQQIVAARRLALELPGDDGKVVGAFLDIAEAAFHRRNELVHSAFPAQSDGRIWGHRATRNKDITDGSADILETTIEEMYAFIQELAELVRNFNLVHALASRPVHQ